MNLINIYGINTHGIALEIAVVIQLHAIQTCMNRGQDHLEQDTWFSSTPFELSSPVSPATCLRAAVKGGKGESTNSDRSGNK